MSELQLSLAPVADRELEVVDGEPVMSAPPAVALSPSPPPISSALEERNLFGEAERIAARAASASTRRQYGAIFRAFGDWLAGELGRPPLVGDLDADVVAAYGRQLATSGGRGGRPAAPATVRVYISMVRALARDLGRDEEIDGVRVPRHQPGPPETLTDTDYANLLRVPHGRTVGGKRDYALLRVLGDCGLRSAELRGLRAASTSVARAVASEKSPSPRPSSRPSRPGSRLIRSHAASGCSTSSRCSCASAATATKSPSPSPPSRCTGSCAGHAWLRAWPERLAHPHALRAYWATHLLEAGVPVHEVSARLGHVDLRTTARYAAPRPERVDEVADVLDRRHQAARRAGWVA